MKFVYDFLLRQLPVIHSHSMSNIAEALRSHWAPIPTQGQWILSWSTTRSATNAGRWPKAVACISCSVTDRLDFEPFRLKVQQWRKLPSHLSVGCRFWSASLPLNTKIHNTTSYTTMRDQNKPNLRIPTSILLHVLDQELEWAGYVGEWTGQTETLQLLAAPRGEEDPHMRPVLEAKQFGAWAKEIPRTYFDSSLKAMSNRQWKSVL